jgi:uracil-DNA glycosylase family 4
MLVGEASGEMEAREGYPFVKYAPAGSVLERVIRRMGLDREQFSITNILRCRPRRNWLEHAPWEYSSIQQCHRYLEEAIAERRPRCIVALGGIALRELTGMAGKQQGISHLAGYVLPLTSGGFDRLSAKEEVCPDCKNFPEPQEGCFLCDGTGIFVQGGIDRPRADPRRIPVIGDFHPAYLRRGKASHQGMFSRVLQRAINISKGTDPRYRWDIDPGDPSTWTDLNWILNPSLEVATQFFRYCSENTNLWLAMDFETAESTSLDEDARVGFADTQIVQAQFAIMRDGKPWAIALPYEGPFRALVASFLHLTNLKFGHNWWQFDEKVAIASAAREGWIYRPPSRIYDTLQMFHHWQPDLPAHLQFASGFIQFPFPWKHLAASNLPFYGCADVHSDLLLGTMLEATLKRDRLWGDQTIGFMGQVYDVRPILDAMERRGVPIDDEARLALDKEFDIAQDQLLAEIQSGVPNECCRLHPKEGYKGVPPEIKAFLGGGVFATPDAVPARRYKEPDTTKANGKIDEGEWYHYEQREFLIAGDEVDAATGDPVTLKTLRWCRVYDFNPNSRNQVIEYMKAKGHTVPKTREEDWDGNRRDTTEEKALRRLANSTGDIFYLKVVEYRGLTKLRSTYIEGFKPGPDGCVHPTFGFDTAIAQLTSKNPNSQNFPKLKPTPRLAQAMRGMVRAKPGKVIVEVDYKSFHVLTLGFLAEDPTWIRLARLDMHSFVAGHVMGLWDGPTILQETDEQLMERFRWLKSDPERKRVRDDQAKHGILGIGNGLRGKGLYERYMENFPPQRCNSCNGTGFVPGVRKALKICPSCNRTGFIPGRRIADTFVAALEKLSPRIFAYQRQERKAAHNAGDRGYYTPFGFARRFYEVYIFSKGWDPVRDAEPDPGDQAEQAVSYRHTNIAHCHMREVMKDLARKDLDEKYGMFNQIHDALQFHFEEPLLSEFPGEVLPIFLAPSKILRNSIFPNGLTVDAESSWGYVWNAMQGITLDKQTENAKIPA